MSGSLDGKVSFFHMARTELLKKIATYKQKKVDFVTEQILGEGKTVIDANVFGLQLIANVLRLWDDNYNVPRKRIGDLCKWVLAVQFNNKEEVHRGKEEEE